MRLVGELNLFVLGYKWLVKNAKCWFRMVEYPTKNIILRISFANGVSTTFSRHLMNMSVNSFKPVRKKKE